MMHLLHGIVAVLVLQEADAEAVELLDDLVAVLRVFIDRLLVDDAVIGDRDLLGVLLLHRADTPPSSHQTCSDGFPAIAISCRSREKAKFCSFAQIRDAVLTNKRANADITVLQTLSRSRSVRARCDCPQRIRAR